MIIGIDPSLTSTGVVILSDAGDYLAAAQIPSSNAEPMHVRCRSIARRALAVASSHEDCAWHVYIEEPGGELKGAAQDCRTLFWFLVEELVGWKYARVEVYATAPSSLKKYMTGRGNATPADKCSAVMARWMHLLPEEFHVSADTKGGIAKFKDLYDGLGLAQLGLTHQTGQGTAPQKEVAGKLKVIVREAVA